MAAIANFQATMLGAIVFLLIGFVFLVKGADFFVEGCSSVAKMLHVPSLIVGLTVVAMGTSLPETAVSISASTSGQNTLAVSNAIGSNIFNLMVVLGVCAIVSTIQVEKEVLKREYPLSVGCAVLLVVLGVVGMSLGRVDGIILLVVFVCFILYTVFSALAARKKTLVQLAEGSMASEENEEDEIKILPIWQCVIFIIGGAVAIKFGGDWVVDSASTIALELGVSATLVGLTICSIGTSLPELVTSFVAAKKNELDMAVGNVVGSNIFNILMVLGIAATVSPIAIIQENLIDICVLLLFSLITWVFGWTKQAINRKEGIFMLVCYVAFMVYICVR